MNRRHRFHFFLSYRRRHSRISSVSWARSFGSKTGDKCLIRIVVLSTHGIPPPGLPKNDISAPLQTCRIIGLATMRMNKPPKVMTGAPTKATISDGMARLMTPSVRLYNTDAIRNGAARVNASEKALDTRKTPHPDKPPPLGNSTAGNN